MTNIHAMHRNMERFLGYNPDNEVRPDTKGALPEEVERSERIRGHYIKPVPEVAEKGINKYDEIIGIFKYNFEEKTEKYFEFKSRGKLRNANTKTNL